ncbi:MAG: transglutaminaseTgpA domain-containing protein [Bacillota bacterium]|nr:transglutaminaseTgpA domain-containing protein [Bacillota bacterium]
MIKRDFPTFILYTFGFLLIWEWIRPLEQLTTTQNINIFILFLLTCFLLSFFQVRWNWQFFIKATYILFFLNSFFYKDHFYKLKWLNSLMKDLKGNLWNLVDRKWDYLTDSFRTLLFFILLWLMVYLIQYWLIKRRRIFIFFLMTVVYISILDTFTPYSAKIAIIRTVTCGFAAMGLLTFYRIIEKEKVKYDSSFIRKWMIPLVAFIVLSATVGFAAPKAAPMWPDPTPYFQANGHKGNSSGSGTGEGKIGKIGYDEDDSRLGGPFTGDKTVVFRVIATRKNYWKVETKDVYTGKGWIESGAGTEQLEPYALIPVFGIPDSVAKTHELATIFPKIKRNYLIYPAGIQRMIPNSNEVLELDTNKEKITSFNVDHEPEQVNSYEADYEVPKYKLTDLQKTTNATEIGQDFLTRYTRLSKSLPSRIKKLTEEITAGKTNWYDKAKAVESYLNGPDFTYDQKKVAVPGENEDYVGQFLFKTKRGYCDNFSSSMAVMLRTIGIPTRWVKGFNSGDFIKNTGGDPSRQIYEITNNHAHSWVEVYFPNQGWVPFEPTKGFTNTVDISYFTNNSTTSKSQETPPVPVKKPQKPEQDDPSTHVTKKLNDNKKSNQSVQIFFKKHWYYMAYLVILLSVIILFLYHKRGRWVPYYILLRYRFTRDDKFLERAYLVLLKQLERYGIKRKKHQTLRQYSDYIDTFFSTREMTRFTSYYEQYLYNRKMGNENWSEARKLWENLIKRTIA